MSFSDYCAYCPHTRNDHSLPSKVCAICTEERDGVPYEPGENYCVRFEPSMMCGLCGGRMVWHLGLRGYFHANEADDTDHEAEPRARRPRKKVSR